MRKAKWSLFSKVLKLALALLMVVTTAQVDIHAAGTSLVLTNSEGEVTTEFVLGEPIYVTANSDSSGDWVGCYSEGQADGSNYWFWYYVDGTDGGKSWKNGETYNLYSTVYNGKLEGNRLPVGNYEIRLEKNTNVNLKFKIVAPSTPTSTLEAKSDTFKVGDPIEYKATSYKEGAWVGLYSGTKTKEDTFGSDYISFSYTSGYNGIWNSISGPAEGNYTIVLFENSGYDKPEICVPITVEKSEVKLITTDKAEYKYGEEILVTTNYASASWVGLYKKGESPESNQSIYWYFPSEVSNPVNILNTRDENGRSGEFKAGEYTIILFSGTGYSVVESVDIIVTKEQVGEPAIVDPTCDKDGSKTVKYSDGTEEVETIPALGHDYDVNDDDKDDWVFDLETKSHTKTCQNDEQHIVTEKCNFGEGVVIQEATPTQKGIVEYTCSVCNGKYQEETSAKEPVGEPEVILEPTCEKDGTLRTYYSEDKTDYIDSLIPAHGHDYDANNDGKDDWVHVEGTTTHIKTCVNASNGIQCEHETVTEDCKYSSPVSSLSENSVTYTCTVCSGTKVEKLISTDKEVYNYGDAINVTINSKWTGSSAWVGLYKKGESYNPEDGGVRSIFWYYQSEQPSTVNILNTRDENNRRPEYIGGEYKVVLFNNDSYNAEIVLDITVNAVETGRVRTEPTCDADGKIVVSYNDGTTKTITADQDETLKALDHDYDVDNDGKDDWTYDSETKSHTKTCVANNKHFVTEKCTFDEGVVTLKPTTSSKGIIKYTCTVCGGSYEDVLPELGLEVTHTSVIEKATCEKDGTLRTYYNDGSFLDSAIPSTGHKYGEWVHNKETHQHTKTCANDNAHVITEDCQYDQGILVSGKYVYTCKECKGTYETVLFETYKTTFKYGEDIIIKTYYQGTDSWVGMYKEGESYNPDTGGKVSIYWYYTASADDSGEFNILTTTETSVPDRKGEFVAGNYQLVLFKDGGYDAIAVINITVTKEVVGTPVTVPATCEKDGSITTKYNDGTTDVEVIPALGHDYGKWVFNASTNKHSQTCINDKNHVITEDCTFDEGEVIKEATETENGQIKYTCEVCKGSYIEEISIKEVLRKETIKEPTCEELGTLRTYYVDGTYIDTNIPALGHNYSNSEWVFDGKDKNTHSRHCANDNSHIETVDCTLTKTLNGNTVNVKCEICKGSYTTSLLTLNKTEYGLSEEILVTAFCENEDSWVGIYKKGEKYDPTVGGSYSLYWYYVYQSSSNINRSGQTINIVDSYYMSPDRQEGLSNGEYKVVLFGDGGYSKVLATIEFTVFTDTTDTTYNVKMNDTALESLGKVEFKEDEKITLNVSSNGEPGNSWVGIYDSVLDPNASSVGTSNYWYYINAHNGQDIILNNKMGLPAGNYTLVIFGDGGYTNVKFVTYFTIAKESETSEFIKEPTCTDYGIKYETYPDGTHAYLPIDPLGHDYGDNELTFDKNTHQHYVDCKRCNEKVIEKCKFDEGVITTEATPEKDGVMTYTCEICKGTYTEAIRYDNSALTPTVDRVYGDERCRTSLKIADELKAVLNIEKFDTIVLASGNNFADALSGSYLASKNNAPIILINEYGIDEVCDYITKNLSKDGLIYVLGGEKAIPSTYIERLSDFRTERLAGATRYETNLAILKAANVTDEEILVATGENYADSLSASAVNRPILLVNKELTADQVKFITEHSNATYYILGGVKAVNSEIESQIRLISNGGTQRLAGATRYETSVKIANRFFSDSRQVVLAYSENFADGLAVGPLACLTNSAVLVVKEGCEAPAKEYINNKEIKRGMVLGGTVVLSDETINATFDNQETVINVKKY